MAEANRAEGIEALGSAEIDALSDNDSGISDTASSTASLRSSIFEYEEEYGRSYHAFRRGKYALPNDEPEQDRMDMQYHGLRLVFDSVHYFAPIARPTAILDIGTGTGIWAIDVADDHPQAHVIGIDLSPIQPSAVPPNLEFQVMDADEQWDFGRDRFDLVHTRIMNGFSIKSWAFFYREAFASLQPGGWVENQEFDLNFGSDDDTLPQDCAMRQWCDLWNEGIQKFGLTGRCYPEEMRTAALEAGFTNVEIAFWRVPIGGWPKDRRLRQAGMLNAVAMIDGISGLSQKVFVHALEWSISEMEILLAKVKNEMQDRNIHSYWPVYVVTAQKPPNPFPQSPASLPS